MRLLPIFIVLVAGLCLPNLLCADRLTLKDGTVLEGRVIRQSNGYWIKLPDDTTQTIPQDQVAHFEKTAASTPAPGAPSSTPTAPSSTEAGSKSNTLAAVKRRADAVENPLMAVSIWQEFIDSKPSDADLATAKSEMAAWQKLNKDGAEKIRGKWMGGEELKELKKKMEAIKAEFFELAHNNQELAAIKKLEEADKLYPDSYEITFTLGYAYLLEAQHDKAISEFNRTLKLKPKTAAATADLGLALLFKKKFNDGAFKLAEAAQQQDSLELAHDLILVAAHLTPAQRENAQFADVVSAANLLASKYPAAMAANPDKFLLVPLNEARLIGHGDGGAKMWSGSGFIIRSDGLILTNRHVAKGAKTLLVHLDDGTQHTAVVLAIDDEQDLALIRIKSDETLPFLKLSKIDTPSAGAECTVMGFPLADRLGVNIKVTRGIVTGIQQSDLDADTLVDAKVNPGNSGGPMINKHGNVMAIVSMKTLSSNREDTYGIGISAGHIRKFLAKNDVTLPTGVEDGEIFSTEDLAAKIRPAAVFILATQ